MKRDWKEREKKDNIIKKRKTSRKINIKVLKRIIIIKWPVVPTSEYYNKETSMQQRQRKKGTYRFRLDNNNKQIHLWHVCTLKYNEIKWIESSQMNEPKKRIKKTCTVITGAHITAIGWYKTVQNRNLYWYKLWFKHQNMCFVPFARLAVCLCVLFLINCIGFPRAYCFYLFSSFRLLAMCRVFCVQCAVSCLVCFPNGLTYYYYYLHYRLVPILFLTL